MKASSLSNNQIRILFLSDSHLGFDDPMRPKIKKRRRGPEFFNSYLAALRPAMDGYVNFVVHGGDLFFRSKVHPSIVEKAFAPLLEIADDGIPVLLVPGNHERANIPVSLFTSHPNIYIFHKPATYSFQVNGRKIGFSGFPYYYKGVRDDINWLIQTTGYTNEKYDVQILCLHHLFSGSRVGVQNYVFKTGKDIINPHEIPEKFDVVLSGHIHTAQKMINDFNNQKIPVPVLYPGSTNRTSFAERLEDKGYYLITIDSKISVKNISTMFKKINVRPMAQIKLFVDKIKTASEFEKIIRFQLGCLNSDSIVQFKISGQPCKNIQPLLTDYYLRELAPDRMNVSFSYQRN